MRYACLTLTSALVATGLAAQEQPAMLDPVMLGSALRDKRSILDTPVAASVVEGEALDTRQASDFEGLIGDIPGVSIDGGPRGIAQEPNIRGFRDEQIVLRFDGGRSNFNQAHRGRFFVDPDIVQRIEILRGGGSTLFGSGALGGVISVETKDATDLLEPGRSFGGRLRAGYASNGEIAQGSLTLAGRSGPVDVLAFGGLRSIGTDLDDGNGDAIRNSQLDLRNGLVKFGLEPTPDQRIELSLSRYEDEGTTPPNANAASGSGDVDRDATVSTARLSWDYAPAGSDLVDLSVLLYGNDLIIEEARIASPRDDRTEYRTVGAEVVNRSRFDGVTLVYGIEAVRDTQEGTRDGAARAQFPDATATTLGAFAEATIAVTDRFEIIPGLRVDRYDRDPDAAGLDAVEEDFVSPRLGFSYRPTDDWQIFGNVARAYRAPTLTELYNDGTHFAAAGFPLGRGLSFSGVNRFVPNPDLKSEKSTQVELGTRLSQRGVFDPADRLDLSVNAYYADVEDYIDQTVTFSDFSTIRGGRGGATVDGTTTSRNTDATLWGLEAEVDYDAGFWFAGAGLTLPRGEDSDGNALGSIPQDRLTATFGLRPTATLTVGARATFTATKTDVPAGAADAAGYEVYDLFASVAPTDGPLARTVFRLGVDNLLDAQYTIYPNALPQPGRTYKISASVAF